MQDMRYPEQMRQPPQTLHYGYSEPNLMGVMQQHAESSTNPVDPSVLIRLLAGEGFTGGVPQVFEQPVYHNKYGQQQYSPMAWMWLLVWLIMFNASIRELFDGLKGQTTCLNFGLCKAKSFMNLFLLDEPNITSREKVRFLRPFISFKTNQWSRWNQNRRFCSRLPR